MAETLPTQPEREHDPVPRDGHGAPTEERREEARHLADLTLGDCGAYRLALVPLTDTATLAALKLRACLVPWRGAA